MGLSSEEVLQLIDEKTGYGQDDISKSVLGKSQKNKHLIPRRTLYDYIDIYIDLYDPLNEKIEIDEDKGGAKKQYKKYEKENIIDMIETEEISRLLEKQMNRKTEIHQINDDTHIRMPKITIDFLKLIEEIDRYKDENDRMVEKNIEKHEKEKDDRVRKLAEELTDKEFEMLCQIRMNNKAVSEMKIQSTKVWRK